MLLHDNPTLFQAHAPCMRSVAQHAPTCQSHLLRAVQHIVLTHHDV